jgi:hypothetical protein
VPYPTTVAVRVTGNAGAIAARPNTLTAAASGVKPYRASAYRNSATAIYACRVEKWRGGLAFGMIPCQGFPVRV